MTLKRLSEAIDDNYMEKAANLIKKRISWITPECFIDVDVPVVAHLQQYFQIRIILVLPEKGIDYKNYVDRFVGDLKNVEVIYAFQDDRLRSLKNFFLYNHIISLAKSFKPDLYYISLMGMPYALALYKLRLPIDRCVVPCHNVSTPQGANGEKKADIYKNLWLKTFKNVQVFSEGQLDLLNSCYPDKNVLLAYLMLKDYGSPRIKKRKKDGVVRFLFFGNVVRYKRLDLLLEAVNILCEKGEKRFKLTIAGNCKNWGEYAEMVKYPEVVDKRIERIPNEDIAELFAFNDYCVFPYQDIAQSGAITVAFQYNLPTIVSDIPQFKEFVIDGKTSLSFISQDAESLADTMQYAIENHTEIYEMLKNNQKTFVAEKFANEAIVKRYKNYFDSIICKHGKKKASISKQ